jgi:hypothetical protein
LRLTNVTGILWTAVGLKRPVASLRIFGVTGRQVVLGANGSCFFKNGMSSGGQGIVKNLVSARFDSYACAGLGSVLVVVLLRHISKVPELGAVFVAQCAGPFP